MADTVLVVSDVYIQVVSSEPVVVQDDSTVPAANTIRVQPERKDNATTDAVQVR